MDIIAEVGQNHNGDMGLAFELIQSAKENGANVAKFQVFDVDKVFEKENNSWYEYNCKTQLSRNQLHLLFEECRKVGIEFMASVFDTERVIWLEELGVKRYKLASRSINDTELINALVKTGKPIIASLGMWNGDEFPVIDSMAAVDFLYCVSKYPAELADLKLGSVDFNSYAGYSDHALGVSAAIVALARGARILEKHFTLDKDMYGPDHACSMSPEELKLICDFTIELNQCL